MPKPKKAKSEAGTGSRLRLENLDQVRRELTRVYRKMNSGEIDVVKGSKLIYALDKVRECIKSEKVETLHNKLVEVEGQ